MADRKIRFMVISRFEKMAREKGVRITLNRYKEQWTADSLLESYRIDEINEAMDYYISITETPSWSKFAYNVDRLLDAKADVERDRAERAERMAKAKAWLES